MLGGKGMKNYIITQFGIVVKSYNSVMEANADALKFNYVYASMSTARAVYREIYGKAPYVMDLT